VLGFQSCVSPPHKTKLRKQNLITTHRPQMVQAHSVTTITLERLIKRGYESLLSYYEKVFNSMNRPDGTIGMV
jgi:hypothetical protein